MGSSSSKSGSAARGSSSSSSSSSSCRVHRSRSIGSSVFQSACLRSRDVDHDAEHQSKECGGYGPCSNGNGQESNLVKSEGYGKFKIEQPDEMPCATTDARGATTARRQGVARKRFYRKVDFRQSEDEQGQARPTDTMRRSNNRSSHSYFTRSLKSSGGFLSRFGFFPGNLSSRPSRTMSDVSTQRGSTLLTTNFSISNNEDELYQHTGAVNDFARGGARQGSDLFFPGFVGNSPRPHHEGYSETLQVDSRESVFSDNLLDGQIMPTQDVVRASGNVEIGHVGLHSPINHTAVETIETRLADRPIAAREPAEQNVQFSRTLSVGRLRDRVLHRTSVSALSYPQQEREDRVGGGRQAWNVETGDSVINGNASSTSSSSTHAPSTLSSFLYNSRDYETIRSRESRYHDLLEHRSHFLERRRRIRSQRLGGRFENLSRHERSCILYHQTGGTGRCSCHMSAQGANPNDDASARSSISRIVVLAEALFEVLDEIHQQSVVLSSRASVSAIGSVPAPIEAVDSLPLKTYTKLPKQLTEDAAQCYICLVEYEEGDSMRTLPCHHEFHRICIDKWLKEVHRVCPLCRRDICRSDSFPTLK